MLYQITTTKKTSALSHAKKGIYKYGNIVEKQGVTV